MHAGDALWYVAASLTVLDRRHSNDPDTLMLVQRVRECVKVISQHIQVPLPPPEKMNALIDQLMLSDGEGEVAANLRKAFDEVPEERPAVDINSSEENVEFARVLLDAMVSSGKFEWSEFITDLHDKILLPDARFSPKQWLATLRVARKADDFWDDFEVENPACVDHAMIMVARA